MNTPCRPALLALLSLLSAACSADTLTPSQADNHSSATLQIGTATKKADITNRRLKEISGITAASAPGSVFWAINDGGNKNELHEIATNGKLLNRYSLPVRNRDWESLSRTSYKNKNYLIIGETGDNSRRYKKYRLHFVAEPTADTSTDEKLTVSGTLTYTFADAKHNVEAMAAINNEIYLITKEPTHESKSSAGKLFKLSLPNPNKDTEQVATYIGDMQLRKSNIATSLAASMTGIDLNHTTALSFSPDQRSAYLLTYRQIVRFEKQDGQNWGDALLGPGKVIHTHGLRQAEAMTVDDKGVLWFTSERLPAPIWSIPTLAQ